MDEADAMLITGHQTAHVFRHYNLGDVESLRDRLTASRAYAKRAKVTPIRGRRVTRRGSPEQRVAG